MKIKVTGYIEEADVPEEFRDPDNKTGLTSEGYDVLIHGDGGPAYELADLSELKVETVP